MALLLFSADSRASLGGMAVAIIFDLFFRPEPPIGRGVFALNVVSFVGLAIVGRFLYSLVGTDFFKRQALVVTSGDVGALLLGELKRAAGRCTTCRATSPPLAT